MQSPVPVQISTHFEPGGRYELLPWYGRPTWQTFLFFLFVSVFGATVISLPIAAIARRLRRKPVLDSGVRVRRMLIWMSSLIGLGVITGLILVWVQIVHIHVGALWGLSPWLNVLPFLGALVALIPMTRPAPSGQLGLRAFQRWILWLRARLRDQR